MSESLDAANVGRFFFLSQTGLKVKPYLFRIGYYQLITVAKKRLLQPMITDKVESGKIDHSEPFLPQLRAILGMSKRELSMTLNIEYKRLCDYEYRHIPKLGLYQIQQLDKLLKKAGISWEEIPANFGIELYKEN